MKTKFRSIHSVSKSKTRRSKSRSKSKRHRSKSNTRRYTRRSKSNTRRSKSRHRYGGAGTFTPDQIDEIIAQAIREAPENEKENIRNNIGYIMDILNKLEYDRKYHNCYSDKTGEDEFTGEDKFAGENLYEQAIYKIKCYAKDPDTYNLNDE